MCGSTLKRHANLKKQVEKLVPKNGWLFFGKQRSADIKKCSIKWCNKNSSTRGDSLNFWVQNKEVCPLLLFIQQLHYWKWRGMRGIEEERGSEWNEPKRRKRFFCCLFDFWAVRPAKICLRISRFPTKSIKLSTFYNWAKVQNSPRNHNF